MSESECGGRQPPLRKLVPRGEWQQGDVPGLLDGASKTALVRGANASETPWNDLSALSHKALQQANIAVRDSVNLLSAELADLLAAEKLSTTARPAGWAATRTAGGWPSAGAGWTRAGSGFGVWSCARLGRPSRSIFRHDVSSSLFLLPAGPQADAGYRIWPGRVLSDERRATAILDRRV